jgi:hypothetical protein
MGARNLRAPGVVRSGPRWQGVTCRSVAVARTGWAVAKFFDSSAEILFKHHIGAHPVAVYDRSNVANIKGQIACRLGEHGPIFFQASANPAS